MKFDSQSLIDLEFNTICELLSGYCKSKKAEALALNLSSFDNLDALKNEFDILKEIQSIKQEGQYDFPHSSSDDIDGALKMLKIENGVLTLDELIRVFVLCKGTKELIRFAKKHKEELPFVFKACEHIDSIDDVLNIIVSVLDLKKLNIKDDATEALRKIRSQQTSNFRAINANFDAAVKRYKNEGYLGDTVETHLNNKRLLSVLSQYKKHVAGKAHGISSKGNFTYIEPKENIALNSNQDQLYLQEKHELYKILESITNQLRSEKHNLEAFQRLLVRFDVYNAKVLFAESYSGVIPKVNSKKVMFWQQAKHPLLLIKNNSLKLDTKGQQIELNPQKRFLVISGPNAGGKSITLKTIGLTQMMFQSGLFVAVDELSKFCWFGQILSDIGDNQSIENQLSTYSYRIKRMQFFLKNANEDSLLLLDEFGSGSDPELGGALAEVFYEELYNKNLFATITTHYTNIKILTSSLPEAENACMLFDSKNFEPLYELSIGQPGSSFTFEVAQFNGVEIGLINKAKEKVSQSKVKFETLSADLQIEKSKFKDLNKTQLTSNTKANYKIEEYNNKLSKLIAKSDQQIQYFEQQNKYVNLGKKVFELIRKFKKHKTNKALNAELLKLAVIEKNKALSSEKSVVLKPNLTPPKFPKQTNQEKLKVQNNSEELKPIKKDFKVGDRVRLKNNGNVAVIESISGKKIEILVGNFVVKTKLSEITTF
jgi:DNA mismatch repair protein MutS2